MSQQQSISEKIGIVQCADGRSAVVYRALRELLCSRCGKLIANSDVFTRWSIRHAATLTDDEATDESLPLLAARCRECVPFDFEETAETDSAVSQTDDAEMFEQPDVVAQPVRSKLMEHLLGLPTEARRPKTATPKPERNVKIDRVESHKTIHPEKALRTTVTEDVRNAERARESVSSAAAEASYSRLAPALNNQTVRAANRRTVWRNKK